MKPLLEDKGKIQQSVGSAQIPEVETKGIAELISVIRSKISSAEDPDELEDSLLEFLSKNMAILGGNPLVSNRPDREAISDELKRKLSPSRRECAGASIAKEAIHLLGLISQAVDSEVDVLVRAIADDLRIRLLYGKDDLPRGSGRLMRLFEGLTCEGADGAEMALGLYHKAMEHGISEPKYVKQSWVAAEAGQRIGEISDERLRSLQGPQLSIGEISGVYLSDIVPIDVSVGTEPSDVFLVAHFPHKRRIVSSKAVTRCFIDLSSAFEADTLCLTDMTVEAFASNRFGWDYRRVGGTVLVIPGSWRRAIMKWFDEQMKRDYRNWLALMLRNAVLYFRKMISYRDYGLSLVESNNKGLKTLSSLITRATTISERKVLRICRFALTMLKSAEGGNSRIRPMFSVLFERVATLDEIGIFIASMLRCLEFDSTLVVAASDRYHPHYLPAFVKKERLYVLDLYGESSMNLRIVGNQSKYEICIKRILQYNRRNDGCSKEGRLIEAYLRPVSHRIRHEAQ